jgi:peptidyl-prolyl cis-trans isomerase SurA
VNFRWFAPLCVPCLVLNAAGEVREEILVEVNSHIITRRVFQQAVEQGTATLYREFSGQELDAKLRTAKEKTLQGLVDSYVIADKAADLGITASDDMVRNYVEEIKKQNNFATDADFDKALKGSMGIGLPEYLTRQKEDMVKQEVLRREVFSKVAVEDQELKAYYEEHRADYKLPGRFRMRELVLPKGVTPEEQADTQAKLAAIQAAFKQGTAFEELVKQYSTAPSRSTGGDLGWLNKGVLRPDLETAILALKPGQITAPVATDPDIYLAQLVEEQLDIAQPFEEVKAAIREKLQEPKAQTAIEAYIQSLRIRANIRYMVPLDLILKG